MLSSDAVILLTRANLADSRNRLEDDLAQADYWAELLTAQRITLNEALDALARHNSESTARLLPAHIIELVRLARDRDERAARVERQSIAARNPVVVPRLTESDKAEADRVFQESLARARAERKAKMDAEHTPGR